MLKNKVFFLLSAAFKVSDVVFIMLINIYEHDKFHAQLS